MVLVSSQILRVWACIFCESQSVSNPAIKSVKTGHILVIFVKSSAELHTLGSDVQDLRIEFLFTVLYHPSENS